MEYEIAIGEGKPLKFDSLESLHSWMLNELNSWSWLVSAYGEGGVGKTYWMELQRTWKNSINSIGNMQSDTPANHDKATFNGQINIIQKQLESGRLIYSKSGLGEYIFAERETSERFAATLAYVASRPENEDMGSQKNVMLAIAALSEFNRGTSKRGASASVRAVEKVRAELEALAKNQSVKTNSRLSKLDNLIQKSEDSREASSSTMVSAFEKLLQNTSKIQADFQTKAKVDVENYISSLKSELEDVKKFYRDELALQEPIQYWSDKSAKHKWATIVLALAFVAYLYFIGNYLVNYAASFEGGLVGFINIWKDASLSAFGAFAGALSLGLIVARILYRLFASQLHLWNDASERVTMIQTYLALAQNGHAKEEFLGALMLRLFSPSSDGVVKDDIGSVSLTDFFSKKVSE